ncbi:MAG: CHASE2 domain-containing protein [Campylobacteraceae bacterium]|nr:CHASE2 domain-containing protein [Campylobacteraceae bacterium]
MSLIYFSFQSYTNNFDTKLREIFFEIRGEVPTSKDIVIVDIDEKSLKQLGQWPFGRDKMAQTLINLTNAQVGIIGLDIVFAEYDRLSPHTLAQLLNVQGDFLDHDTIFGNIISNTPTILGYFFTHEKNDNLAPTIATPIVDVKNTKMLLTANGVVSNITPIQENSYSSGFFNAAPSSTGKITQMPLMMKYNNKIYPSLSLEIIRAIRQVQNTNITYEDNILRGISLDDFLIPTDDKGFLHLTLEDPRKVLNTSLLQTYITIPLMKKKFKVRLF